MEQVFWEAMSYLVNLVVENLKQPKFSTRVRQLNLFQIKACGITKLKKHL